MKFTSQDLAKAMGLKDRDIVFVSHGEQFGIYYIVEEGDGYTILVNRKTGKEEELISIMWREYKVIPPKLILTEDEKVILRNLPKEYKWIVRDDNGDLFVSFGKPTKYISQWGWTGSDEVESLSAFYRLFSFIKWEDEPYEIEELLK